MTPLEVAKLIASFEKKNSKRNRVAVITQGSKSTILATKNHLGEIVVEEIVVPKLDASLIVDTNGAGDAFVGGFLSVLVRSSLIEESHNESALSEEQFLANMQILRECARAGHYAARTIIQTSGCVVSKSAPLPSSEW